MRSKTLLVAAFAVALCVGLASGVGITSLLNSNHLPTTTTLTTTLTTVKSVQPTATVTVEQLQQQQSTTAVYCVQSGPEQQIFVTVVSDANRTPIEGANISGFITLDVNGRTESFPLLWEVTSHNGTVQIQGQTGSFCTIGTYELIILANGGLYSVLLSPPLQHLSQLVEVTVGIPSGRIIDMHITSNEECIANGTTVTNGTGFFC